MVCRVGADNRALLLPSVAQRVDAVLDQAQVGVFETGLAAEVVVSLRADEDATATAIGRLAGAGQSAQGVLALRGGDGGRGRGAGKAPGQALNGMAGAIAVYDAGYGDLAAVVPWCCCRRRRW